MVEAEPQTQAMVLGSLPLISVGALGSSECAQTQHKNRCPHQMQLFSSEWWFLLICLQIVFLFLECSKLPEGKICILFITNQSFITHSLFNSRAWHAADP